VLRVLAEARGESVESAAWYDRQQMGLGGEFLDEIERSFLRIAEQPHGFPRWSLDLGPHDIRRYVLSRFPFVVIYRCRPDETVILAVAHSRRRPFYWRDRIN
jgi:toxin ParE1/3/4